MFSRCTKIALWSSFFLAANGAAVGAQQADSDTGQAEQLCGRDQLCGQYECVTSTPLSEEEVQVSLIYLGVIGPPAVDMSIPRSIAAQRETP